MVVFFSSGWKNSGGTDVTDGGAWSGVWGAPTVAASPFHPGAYAMDGGNGIAYKVLGSGQSDLCIGFDVYFSSVPADAYVPCGQIWDANYENEVAVALSTQGGIYWIIFVNGTPYYYTPPSVVAGKAYRVVLERKAGSGTGVAKIWINGVNVLSETGLTITNNAQIFAVGGSLTGVAGGAFYGDVIAADNYSETVPAPVAETWGLTISASEGGTTSPSGSVNVPSGQPIVVTATPSSGSIGYGTPIKKAAVVYGDQWPSDHSSFIGTHFDFLDTDFPDQGGNPSAVKSFNPNIVVIGYKDLIGTRDGGLTESWYIHDNAGNRLKFYNGVYYLMDVGNAGWRQYWSNYVNNQLNSNPVYDGVFADDAWDELSVYVSWGLVTNASTGQAVSASNFGVNYNLSNWHSGIIGLLQYIKANLPSGKILIPNVSGLAFGNHDLMNISGGMMIETFFHASWKSSSDHSDSSDAAVWLDNLQYGTTNGKIVIAVSGCTNPTDAATILYCYANYLLGVNGSTGYWMWTGDTAGYTTNAYQSIMATDIGQPTGAFYQSQNVYMRDFTNGKVLSNPTGNSYTVNVGSGYKLNGVDVTIVTLGAYSAVILTKSSISLPTRKASTNYVFDHWNFNGFSKTENPITVPAQAVGSSNTLQAIFAVGTLNLTIIASTGGTVNPDVGVHPYTIGSTAQVTATPATGYQFDHWILDGASAGSTNPLVLTMNSSHTLQPVFVLAVITLTIVAGSNGSVSPTGTWSMNIGQTYQITATPNSGYAFSYWDLGGTSVGTETTYNLVATAAMNGKTLTAFFVARPTASITAVSGVGGGISPSGALSLIIGETYVFTATPNQNYAFDHWDLSGASIDVANPLRLAIVSSMNGKTLTAFFKSTVVTVTVNAGANGIVIPSGSQTLQIGVPVTFTAVPNIGYTVDHWELAGLNVSAQSTYQLIPTALMNNQTLSVFFKTLPVLLNVVAGANGTVTPSGEQSLDQGSTVSFVAVANTGYVFDHWDLSGANIGAQSVLTLTVTWNLNGKTLTAYFSVYVPPSITLNIVVNPHDAGSTTPAVGSQTFIVDTTATFTATANPGWDFVNWSFDGTTFTDATLSLGIVSSMNNKTLTANFTPSKITITTLAGANGTVAPSGSQTLVVGNQYSYMATPNTGYVLHHWELSGANVGSANPYTLQATIALNGQTLKAVFVAGQITLNILAEANGVAVPTGTQTFTVGNTYQFAGVPNAGYQVDHWELNGNSIGSTAIISLTITPELNGKTLTVFFTSLPVPKANILIAIDPVSAGSTTPAIGPQEFKVGDLVEFTATPIGDYKFVQWTIGENAYIDNPLKLFITQNMDNATLTAHCFIPTITLNLGEGIIQSPSGQLVIGKTYQFVAVVPKDYTLDHWDLSDINKGSTNPLNLTITEDMDSLTLTAVFTQDLPPQIHLNVTSNDNGTISPSSGQFNIGDIVQFTATPVDMYRFVRWTLSDGTVFTGNPLNLPITNNLNNQTLTAEFALIGPAQAGFPIWSIPIGAALLGGFLLTRKNRGKNRKG